MACPFFEPVKAASVQRHPGARLPLIREFEGFCHASGEGVPAPAEMQFQQCNHGYSRGECASFPAIETRSCFRYTALSETLDCLEVLCIDETDHTPTAWQIVRYRVATGTIEPDTNNSDVDICRRSQAAAFARSYLECVSNRR
jgi:hypothetical protein